MLVAEGAVEIRVLSRQGKTIREIARMLEVSRNTVRRYSRSRGSGSIREKLYGSVLYAMTKKTRRLAGLVELAFLEIIWCWRGSSTHI